MHVRQMHARRMFDRQRNLSHFGCRSVRVQAGASGVKQLELGSVRRVSDGKRGNLLQCHRPHALVPVKGDNPVEAVISEDKLSQVLRALVHVEVHLRAPLVGLRLPHQDEWLVL